MKNVENCRGLSNGSNNKLRQLAFKSRIPSLFTWEFRMADPGETGEYQVSILLSVSA
jgi:hypothetical protein